MMSRGVELPWEIYGRRIRPFSFALMCVTIVVGIQYLGLHKGPGSDTADIIEGVMAFSASSLLILGWLHKNDDIHDWGLLLAAGVWGGRAALYALEQGGGALSIYFSVGWFMAAMGAYLLERYDHKWRYHLVARNE